MVNEARLLDTFLSLVQIDIKVSGFSDSLKKTIDISRRVYAGLIGEKDVSVLPKLSLLGGAQARVSRLD